MDKKLSSAIHSVYARWRMPADHIVCDPTLASGFADEVSREAGQGYRVVEVSRGLLRMRKARRLPRVRAEVAGDEVPGS